MELKVFVRESLKQIVEGVMEAREAIDGKNAKIAPKEATESPTVRRELLCVPEVGFIQSVQFDVAVLTSESEKSGAGFGIFVGPIGAGVKGASGTTAEAANRLSFSVPVLFS